MIYIAVSWIPAASDRFRQSIWHMHYLRIEKSVRVESRGKRAKSGINILMLVDLCSILPAGDEGLRVCTTDFFFSF